MRPTNRNLSFDILLCSLILSLVGIIFIFTASSIPAAQKYGDLFFFPKRQSMNLIFGIVTSLIILKTPIRLLGAFTLPFFLINLILLSGTLIPGLGHSVNGASRWLRLGPITFQPAELFKITLVLFLAKNLSRKSFPGLNRLSGLASSLAPLFLVALLLMMQPDFGTTFLLFCISFAMLFIAGLPLKLVAGAFATGILAIVAAIWHAPYRLARITSFLDPWESAQTGGFQIIQSYLGFYNGGFFGLGLGSSRQKLYFLPEAHTDFILSVIGEELGFIGVAFIICLFAYMVWIGFQISKKQSESFQKLLAFGLTCLIAVQTSINMGVAMGLLPTKGMTLPFISHGSSSLLVFLWVVAILARLNYESDLGYEQRRT